MMKKTYSFLIGIAIIVIAASQLCLASGFKGQSVSLESVLPELDSWELSEEAESFIPESLFEYINGAAEIYISYDFKELIVAQYKIKGGEANISVEIYDMGTGENAFGIYGAERFPDNHFISVGVQGYIEDDTLNFLIGSYYVKLLCFDGGDKTSKFLMAIAKDIVSRVEDRGNFPPLIEMFPKQRLIPNSEKYSLNNFLGYSFFSNGYLANYQIDDLEFDCFIIRAVDENSAKNMAERFLERKKDLPIKKRPFGFVIKDKYYHNVYLAVVKNYVCGVMKIKEGSEKIGAEYLDRLVKALREKD
jgi:hypothetical protein